MQAAILPSAHWGRAAFVSGNVTVTSMPGAVLAWLRLRSGSVVAPVPTHAALNDTAVRNWLDHAV